MILILTSRQDGHIEAVSKHLDADGSPWVRINVEDLATNAEIVVSPSSGTGLVRLRDSHREISLQAVRAVWYRKPEPVSLSHIAIETAALEYIEAEYTEVLNGLYTLLDHAYWINNPCSTRTAHRKILQLRVANQVGFTTPRTLVTNCPKEARRFADDIGQDLAIKSLGAISVALNNGDHVTQYGIFTRRISRRELEDAAASIPLMPTLFQEFICKAYELRVTCVESDVFACRIDHRLTDITADDYRFDTGNLTHRVVECPELHDRLRAYMKFFDLRFGCFDILIDRVGQPIFCECNPNGQWLWIEKQIGAGIGRAIADRLTAADRDTM